MDSQIPFFCGSSENCLKLGHPDAPYQAIQNIEKHFVVVGTLEELDKSLFVMECLMQEYLSGLVKLKKRFLEKNKHQKNRDVVPLNIKARKEMKNRLKGEYIVYNYVKERLDQQYTQCVKDRKM